MTMMVWGRGLLIWGVVGALVSAAPSLLLLLLPGLAEGFLRYVAVLLALGLLPLCLITAAVGLVLLLVGRLTGPGR